MLIISLNIVTPRRQSTHPEPPPANRSERPSMVRARPAGSMKARATLTAVSHRAGFDHCFAGTGRLRDQTSGKPHWTARKSPPHAPPESIAGPAPRRYGCQAEQRCCVVLPQAALVLSVLVVATAGEPGSCRRASFRSLGADGRALPAPGCVPEFPVDLAGFADAASSSSQSVLIVTIHTVPWPPGEGWESVPA
jgi:hypothetical protein